MICVSVCVISNCPFGKREAIDSLSAFINNDILMPAAIFSHWKQGEWFYFQLHACYSSQNHSHPRIYLFWGLFWWVHAVAAAAAHEPDVSCFSLPRGIFLIIRYESSSINKKITYWIYCPSTQFLLLHMRLCFYGDSVFLFFTLYAFHICARLCYTQLSLWGEFLSSWS